MPLYQELRLLLLLLLLSSSLLETLYKTFNFPVSIATEWNYRRCIIDAEPSRILLELKMFLLKTRVCMKHKSLWAFMCS
jgi:hypothetical protein